MVNIFEKGYEFYPTDHCEYMTYVLEKAGKSLGFQEVIEHQ